MSHIESNRIGPYIIGNTLGAGITGKVKLAFDKDTGEQVAIKIISKQLVIKKPSMEEKLEREIAIMKLMDHPNVLHLYDVFETSENLYLVLEYAQNGELFDFLVRKGALNPDLALLVFQQIIEGVAYGHKHFVCHRDLKPENILLDAENQIKLADFGMSGIKKEETLFETSCGSPHYASPEVVQGITYDGEKSDIWSCGVILFALVSGKLPFDNENIRVLLSKVKSGIYTMPEFLPKDVQDLISKMLVVDPEKRITIDEIRNHSWYKSIPVKIPPTPDLIKSNQIVDIETIDDDIIRSLKAFGFGDEKQITTQLTNEDENYEKTFYHLYIARKNEPRTLERNAKRLSRAKSEVMGKSNVSRTRSQKESNITSRGLKQSENIQLTTKKKKKLTRRLSYHVNQTKISESTSGRSKDLQRTPSKQFQRIKLEPKKGDSNTKLSMEHSTKKSWIPAFFTSSDTYLKKVKKKNLKDGIESKKPIGEVTKQLEDTLEVIGATYCFTTNRDRIKARIIKNTKSVKFAITLLKITDDDDKNQNNISPSYWVSFSRRAGDKGIYNEICRKIKTMLEL